jgi:hypothetical protein
VAANGLLAAIAGPQNRIHGFITGGVFSGRPGVLETLHYGLASRRMIAWSRSLSRIRKELGFLDSEEQSED